MPALFTRLHNMENLLSIVDPIIKQTKAVLWIYRDAKWAIEERQDELYDHLAGVGWNNHDTGTVFLTAFAPEIDLYDFENRVSNLIENKLILGFVERAVQSIKQYPEFGSQYYEIIFIQYLSQSRLSEIEILHKLCLERSTFYRRKKEAIFLLGLCLFGLLPKEDFSQDTEQLSLFQYC